MEYNHTTKVETNVEETFAWHERKGAFRRLMPPWETAEQVGESSSLENGSRLTFKFPMGPIKMKWIAEHSGYNPPHAFEDTMISGPFKTWHHVHSFVETEDDTCRVDDHVEYTLPMGVLGRIFGGASIKRRLTRMFRAREIRLTKDAKRYKDFAHMDRKRILIAGSSGLIGRQLIAFFDTADHEVWRLVRGTPGKNQIQWKPSEGVINPQDLEGFDAVIHLGGAGIGDKRWTKKRMELLRESRTQNIFEDSDDDNSVDDSSMKKSSATKVGISSQEERKVKTSREQFAAYRELEHVRDRGDKLRNVLGAMDKRVLAQKKGKKVPIKDANGKITQYKFKAKRAK